MFTPRPVAALAAALLAWPAHGAAQQPDRVQAEMAEIAKDVKAKLEARKENAVRLGEFTHKRGQPSNPGPGLRLALRAELARLGVQVDADAKARVEVRGTYEDVQRAATGQLMVELVVSLHADGKQLAQLARHVVDLEAIVQVLQITVALKPDAPDRNRHATLAMALDQPKAHIAQRRVSADKNSPYSVEVLLRKGGKLDDDGLAPEARKEGVFVKLRRDDDFAVRLGNGSQHDAVVALSMDGLDVFSFSSLIAREKGPPVYPRFLVPAGRSVTVLGWPSDLGAGRGFRLTEYAASAAAEQRQASGALGTVTAVFAAAWEVGKEPPADEPAGSRTSTAIGRGAPVEQPLKPVERRFGVPRAVVTIKYDR